MLRCVDAIDLVDADDVVSELCSPGKFVRAEGS